MPICKKCNAQFPNRTIIDGKSKSLSKRKYCLECSPFGLHNTKQLHWLGSKRNKNGTECCCEICKRVYVYNRKHGHTLKICNSCMANKNRFDRKKKMVEYKGKKCQKCGYDKSIYALEFHHIDDTTKDFNISGAHCRKWEKVKEELDKCIMICSNCHRELHNGITNEDYHIRVQEEIAKTLVKNESANKTNIFSCLRCGKGFKTKGSCKRGLNRKFCSSRCAREYEFIKRGIDGGVILDIEYEKHETSKTTNMPTSDILKNDLLLMTMIDIGKKYNVSDNSVRKWLRKYGLPFKFQDIKIMRQQNDITSGA